MRIAANKLLAGGMLLVLLVAGSPNHAQAAGAAGITITPADIRLELVSGSHQASADIAVTNQYTAAVTLSFAIGASPQDPGAALPQGALALSQPQVVLAAGQQVTQTISLNDGPSLQPGSLLADLVITQHAANVSGVGVSPVMHLPITVVKDSGAVSSVVLSSISGAHASLTMPRQLNVTLRNAGNVIAIPHGTVRIIAPDGTVTGKGVVNGAAQAVLPGKTLQSTVPIVELAGATLPGAYRVEVTYGLGGDSKNTVFGKTFLFIAWWHIAIAILLGALVWLGVSQRYRITAMLRRPAAPPPSHSKRRVLIGRDIT